MENHPRPHILFWIPREQDNYTCTTKVSKRYPDIQGNVRIIFMQIPFHVKII